MSRIIWTSLSGLKILAVRFSRVAGVLQNENNPKLLLGNLHSQQQYSTVILVQKLAKLTKVLERIFTCSFSLMR